MELRGLVLVGFYAGVQPVTRKSGEPVEGMERIRVDVSQTEGRRILRDAVYFLDDLDTGEATAVASQIESLELREGEPIAVKVRAGTKTDSGFVNLTAVGVCRFQGE